MSKAAVDAGRVIVFGSANHDHVLSVEAFPNAGETLISRSYTVGLGGKGANQAVAAARQGGDVAFVGAVGADQAGDEMIANLAANGVDTRGVGRSAASATGVAIVLVDAQGSNEIIVAPGANSDLSADAVDATLSGVGPGDVVVVQCEIPVAQVEHVVRRAAERSATVIVNLAPYTEIARAAFADISLLIVNESEARGLVGDAPAADELADAVTTSHGCRCIVTLGEEGSIFAAPDAARIIVPADRVDHVVDTTGAGDVYVGTLAAALARRADVADAMRSASSAAAASVSVHGAQAPRQESAALATG